MTKLTKDFYLREDVVELSMELLGKELCTKINGTLTSGIITETEAYEGITDKACHAFGNRRTKRTETMFAEGGVAYVYLCYGIHHLFNVVTNKAETPHAVLIRAIEPVKGTETILKRRNAQALKKGLTSGPGTMSQALDITTQLNGTDLCGNKIWIEDNGFKVPDHNIEIGPRIGVDYAEEDALLPYRS